MSDGTASFDALADEIAAPKLANPVDRDRLLAQIVQGILTAHARLDLMENRLTQALTSAVEAQIKAGSAPLLSATTRTAETVTAEAKQVRTALNRLEVNVNKDLRQAADEAKACLSETEQRHKERLDAMCRLLLQRTDEQTVRLGEAVRLLRQRVDERADLLGTRVQAVEKEAQQIEASVREAQQETGRAETRLSQETRRAETRLSVGLRRRSEGQRWLILTCFTVLMAAAYFDGMNGGLGRLARLAEAGAWTLRDGVYLIPLAVLWLWNGIAAFVARRGETGP